MESVPTPEKSLNVKEFTDEELIKLLPVREEEPDPTEEEEDEEPVEGELTAKDKREKKWREAVAKLTAQERQAIEELWGRYSKTTEKYLTYKVFGAASTLCPPQEPDKKHFVAMSLHETYLSFLRRARRQPIRKSIEAFFYAIALCAAIDLRRQIAKKRGKVPPPVEMVPLSGREVIVDKCRGSFESAVVREVRDILENYAGASLANAFSMKVARLRRREGMTWPEVLAAVEKVSPRIVVGKTPGGRMKRLRDFEKHDTNEILSRLQEHNITDPSVLGV